MKSDGLLFILFFLNIFLGQMQAQQAIFLTNPSFEDNPHYAQTPGGWRNCAFNNESPPDIHPVEGGNFQVTQKPWHGDTYLGLVVRDTRSVEGVGQELFAPLEVNRCYTISLMLCRSGHLLSNLRSGPGQVDFDKPAVLRIWGGISPCGQKTLLAESPLINHTDWQKYTFRFRSLDSLSWISFEAYYDPDAVGPYNGNILLDNASPILPLDCETLEPLVDPDTLTVPNYSFQKVKTFGYKSHYFQLERGGYANVSLRIVETLEDLQNLIRLDCPGIGFVSGKPDFIDGDFTILKEVAYNVTQFSEVNLVAGIHDAGEKLTKKRIKALRSIFKEVGLKKDQYRIVVDNAAGKTGGWQCDRELWLKVHTAGLRTAGLKKAQ